MDKIEDIKRIQDFIKEKGLEKMTIFRRVLEFDTKNENYICSYFEPLVGKCFAIGTMDSVSLIGGHTKRIEYNKVLKVDVSNSDYINVYVQTALVNYYNNQLTVTYKDSTIIFNPYQDYYKKWKEISEEEFETRKNEIIKMASDGKNYMDTAFEDLKTKQKYGN